MPHSQSRTHLAEVVRNELVPGTAGAPPEHVPALWAPLAQQRFEVRLHALPVHGSDLALEQAFPLGSKVLLTESADRVLHLKPLLSSHHPDH